MGVEGSTGRARAAGGGCQRAPGQPGPPLAFPPAFALRAGLRHVEAPRVQVSRQTPTQTGRGEDLRTTKWGSSRGKWPGPSWGWRKREAGGSCGSSRAGFQSRSADSLRTLQHFSLSPSPCLVPCHTCPTTALSSFTAPGRPTGPGAPSPGTQAAPPTPDSAPLQPPGGPSAAGPELQVHLAPAWVETVDHGHPSRS